MAMTVILQKQLKKIYIADKLLGIIDGWLLVNKYYLFRL